MPINYELLYRLRERGIRPATLRSLEAQYELEARAKAKAEHQKFLDFIKEAANGKDFEISSEVCMAHGAGTHIWVGPQSNPGAGHRKCLFCGNDDFDIPGM